MSDEVLIPYGDDASDTARTLLAAAEVLELDPGVVRHQPDDGGFRVPEEVAAKGGFGEPDDDGASKSADSEQDSDQKTTKPRKRTAKKTAKKA
jgi:hypothetical protein